MAGARRARRGCGWSLLFVVPFYGVLAVAFGERRPDLRQRRPGVEPAALELRRRSATSSSASSSAELGAVFVRTLVYVGAALGVCFLIGYPVAYYVARLAGRRRGLLLALLLAPFWINYLMRMLAWVNLLQDDGYVNDVIAGTSGSTG